MARIIIDNKSDLPDSEAVELVSKVINGGRISNFGKEYCYLTVVNKWNNCNKKYQIASFLNKKSDRFVVI